MRISIWQQFSSNQSSVFTVVGEFNSPEDAETASHELLNILTTIQKWREAPENAQYFEQSPAPGRHRTLTPPEITLSQQYGIDLWDKAIDWIGPGSAVDERIRQIGNYLFITVEFETWCSPVPIVMLIDKIGGLGDAVYDDYGDLKRRIVHLECTAPDEDTAQKLYVVIDDYTNKNRPRIALKTPWWVETKTEMDHHFTAYASGPSERNGVILTFPLQFQKLGVGLPALVKYLTEQGCTNIEFTIRE